MFPYGTVFGNQENSLTHANRRFSGVPGNARDFARKLLCRFLDAPDDFNR